MSRWQRRALVAFLAAALIAGLALGWMISRKPTVKGLRVCPGDLRVIEVGALSFCSHGPDPVGVTIGPICLFGICPLPLVNPPPTYPCVGDGISDERIVVYYAHRDAPRDDWLTRTRASAAQADALFFDRTGQHYRYLCSGGLIAVRRVQVRSGSLADFIAAVGEADPDRFYAAFNELAPEPFAGMATHNYSEVDEPTRHLGPMFSTTKAFAVSIYVHELGHNLGSVNLGAPHSSGAGHCWDENDLMCYNDGGSKIPSGGTREVCSGEELFDCRNDDYHSANPRPGSYLASRWNTFDSLFLTPKGG